MQRERADSMAKTGLSVESESSPMASGEARRSMLHRILSQLVQRIRPGRLYQVHPATGQRSLISVMAVRGTMLLRGSLRRVLLRRVNGFLFLGRHVVIRHGHLLRLGHGVLIEDGVFIDALGEWGVTIGDGVTIGRGVIIRCSSVLTMPSKGLAVGDHSALGDYSFVGATGGIVIGRNVLCGQRVSFHSENHEYSDPTRLIRDQSVSRRGIEVEDDCWIGSGAIILDGVCIGKGSVVGAGSVVTKSLPPFSIAAGVPARVTGQRGNGKQS